MNQIFNISGGRLFSQEEATELLPIILKITRSYSDQVKVLVDQIEEQPLETKDQNWKIEEKVNKLIDTWKIKVQRLGITPRGLWIGDFPTQDGFYCWKYPETEIKYWHAKDDGFSKRKNISLLPNLQSENSL